MFNNSHDFYIKNLFQSEGGGNDVVAMTALHKLADAACLGAGHQSNERHDAPKSHPDTRKDVINDIMSWVNAKDSNKPIMWMSGPAGAGKSAVAQTVCERCYQEEKLLASFFFCRGGRSDGSRLVATIACQVAIAIPDAKKAIIKQLQDDPAILSYSIEKQLQKLVLEPLAHIDLKADDGNPYLIVIDGLDECNDPKVQVRIVKMFSEILHERKLRLRLLIASRLELEIQNSFRIVVDDGLCASIILDENYKPDDDIRIYLKCKFDTLKREHTLLESLLKEPSWPSSYDMDWLVQRSSGQFIYPSTVVKYLENPRRDPRKDLCTIVGKCNYPVHKESLYAPLDSLYKHILTKASASGKQSYDYKIIFQILLFAYQESNSHVARPICLIPTVTNLSYFIGMEKSELELLLADLHSIICFPSSNHSSDVIKFHHASFEDYLSTSTRSRSFYISEVCSHKYLAERCIAITSEIPPEMKWEELNPVQQYVVYPYFQHLRDSKFDEELLLKLRTGTSLHKVLRILTEIKDYYPLGSVMEFSFTDKDSIFWSPRSEKIRDICSTIVELVEAHFLTKRWDLLPGRYQDADLMIAVRYNATDTLALDLTPCMRLLQAPHIYSRWLGYFLDSSAHGKHLYLGSTKSCHLYKHLVMENWKRYYEGKELYYPFILKYLLMKIKPSAYPIAQADLLPNPPTLVLKAIEKNANQNECQIELLRECINDLCEYLDIFRDNCRVSINRPHTALKAICYLLIFLRLVRKV